MLGLKRVTNNRLDMFDTVRRPPVQDQVCCYPGPARLYMQVYEMASELIHYMHNSALVI